MVVLALILGGTDILFSLVAARAKLLEFDSWFTIYQPCPWERSFTSLSLTFLSCKVGVVIRVVIVEEACYVLKVSPGTA